MNDTDVVRGKSHEAVATSGKPIERGLFIIVENRGKF